MFEEIVRQTILVVVCAVLLVRTPAMVRDSQQRPLWLLLVVLAGGSIVIQSWFGQVINRVTGISQFNNLVQGVWGVLDVAVLLELALRLVAGTDRSRARRVWRWAATVTMLGMTVAFLLTPAAARFTPPATFSPFTGYALLAAAYMIPAAAAGSWALVRHLPAVRGPALRAGMLMMAAGNATEIPFMTERTLQRLTSYQLPVLLQAALLLNTARFILLPLGCVTVMIEPLGDAVAQYYWRARLYSLWRLLRDATGELALTPPVPRWRDVLTIGDAWALLHQRLVEIRDSVFYLYDTWAWPELIEQARRHASVAAPPEDGSVISTACWLEVTRRDGRSTAPRRYRVLDRNAVVESLSDHASTRAEVHHLCRLHRAMRSPAVRHFAETRT